MTFYNILGAPTDASTEEIKQVVQRQRSALADDAVYPATDAIEGEQLRQDREELIEEAAGVLLDSTSKAAYDTFLRELGDVNGHLEYLHWRMHPARESLSTSEWIERYGNTETRVAHIDKTRILSTSDTADEDTNQDGTATDSDSRSTFEQTTDSEQRSPHGALGRWYEVLRTAVTVGLGLVLVLFRFVYRGITSILAPIIGITVSALTLLRAAGASLSLRSVGVAALGFPFVFFALSYGTMGLAGSVSGTVSETVMAGGLLLIVSLHLVYILTPRAGIPVFGLFAAVGYLASTNESLLLTYVYLPCCVLSIIALVAVPGEA